MTPPFLIVSLEEVTTLNNPNDGFRRGLACYREDFVRFCKEGDPDAESTYGKMLSKPKPWFKVGESLRQILNRRVEAVRLLFERDPELLKRLRRLSYDFSTGELRESSSP